MNLTKRQYTALKDIARYTRKPTETRYGYSVHWTPKTNETLVRLGLVEFVHQSVVITDAGLAHIEKAEGVGLTPPPPVNGVNVCSNSKHLAPFLRLSASRDAVKDVFYHLNGDSDLAALAVCFRAHYNGKR